MDILLILCIHLTNQSLIRSFTHFLSPSWRRLQIVNWEFVNFYSDNKTLDTIVAREKEEYFLIKISNESSKVSRQSKKRFWPDPNDLENLFVGILSSLGAVLILTIVSLRKHINPAKRGIHLLLSTLYYESDLPQYQITCRIIQDILYSWKFSDSSLNIYQIIRIGIEHSLLSNDKKNFVGILKKIDEEIGFSKNRLEDDTNEKILLDKKYIIETENCFPLNKKELEIERYLKAIRVSKIRNNIDRDFFCYVRIRFGFIAPLYLIGGPLKKFEDDWNKIQKEYEKSLDNPTDDDKKLSKELRSFKSSQFTTWISWGPSIPVCNCKQWQDIRKMHTRITLQYGFGDENNSIPLLMPQDQAKEKQCLEKLFDDIAPLIVRRSEVVVKPSLLSSETQSHLARAINQSGVYSSEIVLKVDNSDDMEPFQLPRGGDKKILVDELSGYYTAYVWVLFGVYLGEDPTTFNPKPDDEKVWRKLLPFWEHVNLAQPLTYQIQLRLLGIKVLDFIKRYAEEARQKNIHFIYLCSFDHTNCESKQGTIAKAFSKDPIRRIILDLKQNSEYKDLPISFENSNSDLSSCHLPELVKNYNEYLKKID